MESNAPHRSIQTQAPAPRDGSATNREADDLSPRNSHQATGTKKTPRPVRKAPVLERGKHRRERIANAEAAIKAAKKLLEAVVGGEVTICTKVALDKEVNFSALAKSSGGTRDDIAALCTQALVPISKREREVLYGNDRMDDEKQNKIDCENYELMWIPRMFKFGEGEGIEPVDRNVSPGLFDSRAGKFYLWLMIKKMEFGIIALPLGTRQGRGLVGLAPELRKEYIKVEPAGLDRWVPEQWPTICLHDCKVTDNLILHLPPHSISHRELMEPAAGHLDENNARFLHSCLRDYLDGTIQSLLEPRPAKWLADRHLVTRPPEESTQTRESVSECSKQLPRDIIGIKEKDQSPSQEAKPFDRTVDRPEQERELEDIEDGEVLQDQFRRDSGLTISNSHANDAGGKSGATDALHKNGRLETGTEERARIRREAASERANPFLRPFDARRPNPNHSNFHYLADGDSCNIEYTEYEHNDSGDSYVGHKNDRRRYHGRSHDGRRSDERGNDGHGMDGHGMDGHGMDGHGMDGRGSYGRRIEDSWSGEYRTDEYVNNGHANGEHKHRGYDNPRAPRCWPDAGSSNPPPYIFDSYNDDKGYPSNRLRNVRRGMEELQGAESYNGVGQAFGGAERNLRVYDRGHNMYRTTQKRGRDPSETDYESDQSRRRPWSAMQ